MKRYLFCGPDILTPAGSSGLELDRELPGSLAARAVGARDYEAGGLPCSAHMLDEAGAAEAAAVLGLRRLSFREALASCPAGDLGGALRGMALLRALEVARFCGACGGALRDKEAGGEDSGGRQCERCGRVFFPRISPAVILLIRKGPRALLAHNARFRPGLFGLIAGFAEAGESLEEAAVREAREEAGIEIGRLRYVKSQSWPFPDSLMVAFVAEWISGEARPDGVEIAELRWCLPSELPEIPAPGSVARFLLDEFSSGSE